MENGVFGQGILLQRCQIGVTVVLNSRCQEEDEYANKATKGGSSEYEVLHLVRLVE